MEVAPGICGGPSSSVGWIVASSWIAVLMVAGLYCAVVLERRSNGPRRWPLLGSTLEEIASFEYHHDWITEYAKRLRTFQVYYMLSHRAIYTTHPANIHHFLRTNFSNYYKGETAYEVQRELFGDGIFNSDGENWRQQRKMASSVFSTRTLRDYSTEAFRKYAVRLANILADAAVTKAAVDMNDLFMRMTFDSTCEVGFGIEMGTLSQSLPVVPFVSAFDRSSAASLKRYFDPLWKFKRLLNIGSEAQLKEDVALLDEFTSSLIQRRRHEMNADADNLRKRDLLSRFITLSKEDPSCSFTDKKLRDVVLGFVMAGRDTTAGTLSWFMFLLSQHPEVETKIIEEINAASSFPSVDHNPFSACSTYCAEEFAGMLTYESLGKMHYLHAAISETLRLYPAVPEDGRMAIADDVLPDGTQVRAGDEVMYAPYAMGRMEVLWGDDACQFKPERWLKDGVFVPQSPFKFTAFHAGPRMCLGKDYAFLQMKMTAALLLRLFKFSHIPDQKVSYSMAFTLLMSPGGLKMKVDPRSCA